VTKTFLEPKFFCIVKFKKLGFTFSAPLNYEQKRKYLLLFEKFGSLIPPLIVATEVEKVYMTLEVVRSPVNTVSAVYYFYM